MGRYSYNYTNMPEEEEPPPASPLPRTPSQCSVRSILPTPCMSPAPPLKFFDDEMPPLQAEPVDSPPHEAIELFDRSSPIPSVSPTDSSGSASVVRHESYYLEDGLIMIIEVENILFKVPRYMLSQESSLLASKLVLCDNKSGPGSSNSNPFRMDNVTAEDFTYILSLLYPKTSLGKPPVYESWQGHEWGGVFKLASMWDMQDIRNFAVGRLSSLASSMEKLFLGKEYSIHPWIREGYLDLCLRKERVSVTDAQKLGFEQTLLIASARERIREEVDLRGRSLWVKRHTRYGHVDFKEMMSSGNPEVNARMPAVHAILDEVFGLKDTADI